jgi:hypothetical protein
MGLGICSMVSGFFGMNLSNSVCGPDGCLDYISDPNSESCDRSSENASPRTRPLTRQHKPSLPPALASITDPSHFETGSTDHGHRTFLVVCAMAVTGAVLMMSAVFLVSRAASGDPFWTRALRVKGKTLSLKMAVGGA